MIDALILFLLGHLFHHEAKANIVFNRHMREEGIVLEHHVDIPFIGRKGGHVLVIQINMTSRRMLKAGNHAEDGRLAAARRAEEGDKFSVANGKVQGRDDGILFKFLGNAYQSDHLFHLCCVTTFLYQWIFARKALIWLKISGHANF